MFRLSKLLPVSAAIGLLSACATPTAPVNVTRFHRITAPASLAGPVLVRIEGPKAVGGLEDSVWTGAVSAQLSRLGFIDTRRIAVPAPLHIAVVRHIRTALPAEGIARSPVSVGVGGATGRGYGSGVGVGVGVDLGSLFGTGKQAPRVVDELSVRLERASDHYVLWEGRAEYRPAGRDAGNLPAIAEKLSAALFRGFPGENGKSIRVP